MLYSGLFLTALLSQLHGGCAASTQTRAIKHRTTQTSSIAAYNNLVVIGDGEGDAAAGDGDGDISFSYYSYHIFNQPPATADHYSPMIMSRLLLQLLVLGYQEVTLQPL